MNLIPRAYLEQPTRVTASRYSANSFPNPDAVMQIANGASTTTYDNNGNITGAGPRVYSWTYGNRLISAGNGPSTTTYGYRFNDLRHKQTWINAAGRAPIGCARAVGVGSVSSARGRQRFRQLSEVLERCTCHLPHATLGGRERRHGPPDIERLGDTL
jgi:hypothetical protein